MRVVRKLYLKKYENGHKTFPKQGFAQCQFQHRNGLNHWRRAILCPTVVVHNAESSPCPVSQMHSMSKGAQKKIKITCIYFSRTIVKPGWVSNTPCIFCNHTQLKKVPSNHEHHSLITVQGWLHVQISALCDHRPHVQLNLTPNERISLSMASATFSLTM